jgi:hypothetical protein
MVTSTTWTAEFITDSTGIWCDTPLRFTNQTDAIQYAQGVAQRSATRKWRITETSPQVVPTSITGALNLTQFNQTLSATGIIPVIGIFGTLNIIQANQTLIAIGSIHVNSVLSITQANQILIAVGSIRVNSVLSITQANQTLVAAGTVPNWYDAYTLPNNQHPSIVLDFVNNRYYDGVTGNATLSSLVANSPTISASGMLCNAENFNTLGRLTSALQNSAVTIRAETMGPVNSSNFGSVVGFSSGLGPDCPLFNYSGNVGSNANNINLPVASLGNDTWAGDVFTATSWDGTGRSLLGNVSAVQSDANTFTGVTGPVLGAYNNNSAFLFTGYIRNLVLYPVRLTGTYLKAMCWPLPFLFPFAGSHSMRFDNGQYITPGSKLIYERTQPWTCMVAINIRSLPSSANVYFTNVTGSPYYGYEFWNNQNGYLCVRLMSNFTGGGQMCSVIGSRSFCDGKWHVVTASYDGSSMAAGIKLYIDGVQDTGATTESDNLTNSIISGTPAFWVGNQSDVTNFNINGGMGYFNLSNIVRSPAYIATNSGHGVLPAVDANTVLYYKFQEGIGMTTADASANNFTGTLSATDMWL